MVETSCLISSKKHGWSLAKVAEDFSVYSSTGHCWIKHAKKEGILVLNKNIV